MARTEQVRIRQSIVAMTMALAAVVGILTVPNVAQAQNSRAAASSLTAASITSKPRAVVKRQAVAAPRTTAARSQAARAGRLGVNRAAASTRRVARAPAAARKRVVVP